MKKSALLLLFLLCAPLFVFSDMSFIDLYDEYRRVKILSGEMEPTSLFYHSYSSDSAKTDLDWNGRNYSYKLIETSLGNFNYMAPELFISYNSHGADGRNDGAMWQGKGLNATASLGMEWRSTYLDVRFNPQFWFAMNEDFTILPTSASGGYGDYWSSGGLDRLQRMGEDPLAKFSWGQSDIRLKWNDLLTLGVSTENIVIGNARVNNILMSKNAEGIPHVDFGTYKPLDIWKLGQFETKIYWGVLKESEHYDNNPDNDYAWLSGLSVSYAPSFIQNLTIGATHQYYKPMQYWNAKDLITFFPFFNSDNRVGSEDDQDAMWSLNFDWRFPSVGFQIYGEFGINDHSHPAISPEHTSAFTIGGSQIIKFPFHYDGHFVLSLEHTNMGQTRTAQIRPAGPWYRHAFAGWEQGFVNKGQLPGAAIGPGSNSQLVDFTYYHEKGLYGFSFMRVCLDNDYFYNVVVNQPEGKNGTGQNVELEYGLRTMYFLNDWNLYGKMMVIYAYNHNWEYRKSNFRYRAELGLSYQY